MVGNLILMDLTKKVTDSETFRQEVLCYDHDLSQVKLKKSVVYLG